MARILMSGNEIYDYLGEGWTVQSGIISQQANQPGGRRTVQGNGGKAYMYLTTPASGPTQLKHTLFNPSVGPCTGATTGGLTEIYGRIGWQANTSSTWRICTFTNSNTGLEVASLRMVQSAGNNSFIAAYNGAGSNLVQSASTFVTNSTNTNNNGFRRIEWHLKTAASGAIFECWIDDVLFFSNSTLNLSNGTTINFDTLIIGDSTIAGNTMYFDDVCVNDLSGNANNARLGEGVIIALFPGRTGTYSQLQNTFGTTTENYDHINRPVTAYNDPLNNTLYVGTNTPYAKDTYKEVSLPAEIGGVSAVKVVSNCVRNGAAITNAKVLVSPGVVAPVAAITAGAITGGGNGTAGDHQFVAVNKIGTGWSLPSPLSAVVTLTAGQQVALTVPTYLSAAGAQVTSREIYASKANTDTTIAAGSNGVSLPQATIFVASSTPFATLPATTIAAGSNGINLNTNPGVINVVSTAGFPNAGTMSVVTGAGTQTVTYTNITTTAFFGVVGGTGVMSTGGAVTSPVGLVYIQNTVGQLQQITYTSVTGGGTPSLNGCSGGVGALATGGFVTGALYLVGTLNDNTTTAFQFNVADGSFGTQTQPYEAASSNIALPNGAFGYIENIFDHNPVTGNPYSRDEIEHVEIGLQFTP